MSGIRDEEFPVEIVSRSTPFEGAIWNVNSDTFRYGDGEITRQYVDHTSAVAILAVDDAERMLLIQQYRHPIGMRDWEIPAGLLDQGSEAAFVGAQRELAEEADLEADEWQVLADYFTSPGGSNEGIRIYLARGIRSSGEPFEREAEEADIHVEWAPWNEAVQAVLEGRIHNSTTIVAVMTYAAARGTGFRDCRPVDAPWPGHAREELFGRS